MYVLQMEVEADESAVLQSGESGAERWTAEAHGQADRSLRKRGTSRLAERPSLTAPGGWRRAFRS
jgi:hypothetical protein